ncbi:MAG: serine/threonine-protein phosphatase [Lachnospiraceae bacterium]|nr:serine/threonine-protein phosphatase [Lachnospiraceae bacterium]
MKIMDRLEKPTIYIGFGLTQVMAVACVLLGMQFFTNVRPDTASLFHAGVDVLGAFVCVVLFYGCMWQIEMTTRSFGGLVILTSASFFLNELMWFIVGTPRWHTLYFGCCILSKWFNLTMIYLFFLYIRGTMQLEGKLTQWADRGFPILLVASMLIVLANVLFPITFAVDAGGMYSRGSMPWLEDIYLLSASVITTILIFRSANPSRQKWAAMSFILIPILEFLVSGGAFAYAAQYASVLLALILMYCILFNARSKKLAATQAELTMATQIQEAMLPSIFPAFPNRQEFDIYASMDPAKEVGGDFYDFFLIDEDHLGMIIADVSGKGVPAALVMMISKIIMQNYAKQGAGAAEILEKTNETLCADNRMEMFVTAWVGILEIPTGKMTCANAGHEYPVVCRNGRFELLKDKHGFVLGGMEGMKYKEYEILLEKGDKIFVYTDGVPEAANREDTLFGTDRMTEVLNRKADVSPEALLKAVREAVDTFTDGAEQFDDLTMLCLEYKGGS